MSCDDSIPAALLAVHTQHGAQSLGKKLCLINQTADNYYRLGVVIKYTRWNYYTKQLGYQLLGLLPLLASTKALVGLKIYQNAFTYKVYLIEENRLNLVVNLIKNSRIDLRTNLVLSSYSGKPISCDNNCCLRRLTGSVLSSTPRYSVLSSSEPLWQRDWGLRQPDRTEMLIYCRCRGMYIPYINCTSCTALVNTVPTTKHRENKE